MLPDLAQWSAKNAACRVCGKTDLRVVEATERMFGFGGQFIYQECGSCGVLELLNPPSDLSDYYPKNYYSFGKKEVEQLPRVGFVRRWVRSKRNQAILFGKGGFWGALANRHPDRLSARHAPYFRCSPNGSFDMSILDVGCGNGKRLRALRTLGFQNLYGVDPYLDHEVNEPGLTIRSCHLEEVKGQYDLIMFHHSFEHFSNQDEVLTTTREILAPGGVGLIRMPVAGCRLWREAGTFWMELDPPRHLCLQTPHSFRILARRAGFRVLDVQYDATPDECMVTELYQRGITLVDPQTRKPRNVKEYFSKEDLARFREQAEEDNITGTASRGVFYITKADSAIVPNDNSRSSFSPQKTELQPV